MLLASCPVRGRVMRRSEVDRAKAWPGRGNPSRPDAAPAACVSQTWHRGALGNRPGHYGASAFNGWTGLEREGESLRDHAQASSCRKHGPRVEEVAAAGR